MKELKYAGIKVLLMDNNKTYQLLIESILKDSLDEVLIKTAETENVFQKLILKFRPDVVISCNGIEKYSIQEAIQWLVEQNFCYHVILINDKIDEAQKQWLIENGVEDFIGKGQLIQLPSLVLKAYEKGKIKSEKSEIETLLKVSNHRLETFFRYAPEAIINIGLNGKILELNPAALEILSIKCFNKLRDKLIWNHIVKEDLKLFRKAHQRVSRGHNETIQFRIDSGYRRITWLECNMVPIRDEEGGVSSVLAISRDITIQKNALKELNYQAALTKNIVDAVITVDQDFVIQSWNKGAERLYEYTCEEAKGKVINELVKVVYEKNNRNELMEALIKTGHITGENIGHTKSGQPKNVFFSISKLITDHGLAYVGIYRDITSQKKADQQIKESEEKFSKVFHYSSAGISITRMADRKFIDVNDRLLQIMGFAKEEIIGHTSEELGIITDHEVLERMRRELIENGSFRDIEQPLLKSSGEKIHVLTSTDIVLINNEPHAISILHDISDKKKANELLNLHATITHNMFAAVISTDENFIIKSWNNGAEKLYGFCQEEVIGQPIGALLKFVIEEDAGLVIRNRLLQHGYVDGEIKAIAKSGEEKNINYRASHLVNEKEDVIGYVLLHLDLTHLKLTERKLAEAENYMAATMETLPAMIWSVDANLNLTYYNSTMLNTMREVYNIDLIPGMHFDEFVPATKFPQLNQKQRNYYNIALTGVTVSFEDTLEINGEIQHLIISFYPVLENEKVVSITCIAKDISEFKTSQEIIAKSEIQFRTLSTHSPVGIYLSDYKGHIEYANEKFSELTGIPRDKTAGLTYFDAMHPDDKERTRLQSNEFRKTGLNSQRYQLRFVKPDGRITWAIVQSNALRKQSGMIYGYVGTITDITEQIEKENAIMEKTRRLKFAQSMAHIGDWTLDMVTKTREWSEEMYNIYEYDAMDGIPSFEEFITHIHLDDREKFSMMINKTFEDQTANQFFFRFILASGKEKTILSHIAFSPAGNGYPDRLVGTAQDVTNLKATLEKSNILHSVQTG